MIKPNSVRWFERLYVASILIWLVLTGLEWQATKAQVEAASTGQMGANVMVNIFVGFLVFQAVLAVTLWYFAARQRSDVARWVLVFCLLCSGWSLYVRLTAPVRDALPTAMGVAVFVFNLVAVVMLFRADAAPWFGRGK